MSEIPKRPDSPDIGQRDADYLWENFYCAEAKHEHAVAKVAVEALRRLMPRARGIAYEGRRPEFAVDVETAAQALAVIEASGWTP